MANVNTSLTQAMQITGAVGACLVDIESGMCLAQAGGGGLNLDVAAAGNTEVIRAKMRTMKELGLNDEIDDILITLSGQYHLIRLLKGKGGAGLFIYLALDKQQANLAMTRHKLTEIEKNIVV
jgi:hypothetical protein